jgi:hypothetical protein
MSASVGVAILGAILFVGLRERTAAAVARGVSGSELQHVQLAAYHRTFLWVVIFYALAAVAAFFVRDADAASTMRERP